MLKLIAFLFLAVVGYMIFSGNMGGAQKATQNYQNVMYKGRNNPNVEAKPAPIYQYIKNKQKGSIK